MWTSAFGARSANIDQLLRETLEDSMLVRDFAQYRVNLLSSPPRGMGIQLEDNSSIPLIERLPSPAAFQLRARLRAETGDVVLSNCRPPPGYEHYNLRLGLGKVRWQHADGDLQLARSAWESSRCFQNLVSFARAGPVYIHPYIASRDVWDLANRLSSTSERSVAVVGPPPALCELVNDKVRFCHLVRRLIGPEATPVFKSATTHAGILQVLRRFVAENERVALRLPACTAGVGTTILDCPPLRIDASEQKLVDLLDVFLREVNWNGQNPVMIVRWEDVALSMSVQLWIPPEDMGEPFCEGFFEQRFAPQSEIRFQGAAPVRLPHLITERITSQSLTIGTLLQRLGYRGRCSFDIILVGDALDEAHIRFVECNGRWGGVSIVMSFLNRLFGDHRSISYMFGAVYHSSLRSMAVPELLRILRPELFGPEHPDGGLLVYNVGCMRSADRIDVVALGKEQAEAEYLLHERLPNLLEKA